MKRIAVLVDTAMDWGREVLSGVSHYAQQHEDWQLFFEPRGPAENLQLPQGWQGEGVIARIKSPEMLVDLKKRRLPVVNVSAIHLPGQTFPTVTSDMKQIAQFAANYLFDRGFRHFAYLSLTGLEYVARQQKAFVRAVAERKCSCAVRKIPSHQESQSPDWNLNLEELGAWIQAQPKPLAILTWSGAQDIILACQRVGLRVPEDVAVLASLEDFSCRIANPPISAIQSDTYKIGFEAARLLAALMKGRKPPRNPLLIPPLRVISRQSTDVYALDDPIVLAALHFIRNHLSESIQVSDIARHVGTSRRVLERRFTELLKRSPGEELRRCRILKASALLRETNLSIAEVAECSGFGSPEYMTYVFRKEKNISPLRYRKDNMKF